MSDRQTMNQRARGVGINPALYANDSVLEQRVLYNEKLATTNAGAAGTGTLTSTGVAPTDGDVVTIGGVTYTAKTALSTAPTIANQVLIGASAATFLTNLGAAINGSAGVGTTYSYGTVANPDVVAGTITATTVALSSRNNSYINAPTTKTAVTLSFGAVTLTGGAPAVVAPVAVDVAAISGAAAV